MRPPRRDSRGSRCNRACDEEAGGQLEGRLNGSSDGESRQHAPWYDPGSLVESYFRDCRHVADAPETILLAWLAILPPSVEPPAAARSLLCRLAPAVPDALSRRQRRLLGLLAFTARHCRKPSAVADDSNTFED